jgi:hypothetical protein
MAVRLSRWLSSRFGSGARDAAVLAGALVAGVLFLVPVVARLLGTRGIATGMALVVPLVVVCVAYGLLVYRTGRVPLGLFVAFAVFVTVWAPGLPWTPAQGSLAWATTQSQLAGIALVGLLVCYTWHGWNPRTYFSRAHIAFGGFVVWTFLSVPFVTGPHPSFAFQFGLYVLQAWAVFAVVSWLAETGRLSLPAVSVVFATVVVGHAAVGLFEFLEGTSFGLAGTSEGAAVVSRLSLGPFGFHPVGPYVSGFVGSGALGSLIPMVAPLVFVLALRTRGPRRFAWAASWLLCAFVLRMTGWDTGRGAFLLGTAVVSVGLAWRYRAEHGISIGSNRMSSSAVAVLTATLGVVITLLPSADARSPARVAAVGTQVVDGGVWQSLAEAAHGCGACIVRPVGAVIGVARAANETANATNASAGYGPKHLPPEGIVSAVDSLSIPLFDLSGLGVRLRQVVAGLDLFLQHPLFGIGGANFYFVAEAFGLPKPMWLHNAYVALLAETGLLGFLFYAVALGFVVAAGWRLLARGDDRRDGDYLLVLGVVAALCAHLGTMLFQPTYIRAQILFPFWALCGLLVGTERHRSTQRTPEDRTETKRPDSHGPNH